jgi:DNA-directed RNA polymerase specialized sigma24 family protein
VALLANARRELLLRAYRRRLRREDLEDCYSQATLELIAYVRTRGFAFASTAHLANALEQRFRSRIGDRLRALGGRSAMQAALEQALAGDGGEGEGIDVIDLRSRVDELVLARLELARLVRAIGQLSADQKLVLVSQISLGISRAEFCRSHGWSFEKYRKVAQRARARLRDLADGAADVPLRARASEKEVGTHL